MSLSSKHFVAASLLLGACATPKDKTQFVHVPVEYHDNVCAITIDGQRITAEDLLKMPRTKKRRNAALTLDANTDIPYRCIGSIIYGLQALGYRKVGFIGEPPP